MPVKIAIQAGPGVLNNPRRLPAKDPFSVADHENAIMVLMMKSVTKYA